jgi:hypothetical protein
MLVSGYLMELLTGSSAIDGYLRLLTHIDGYWRLLEVIGGYWRFLTVIETLAIVGVDFILIKHVTIAKKLLDAFVC